ncbi:hypothetical protein D0861_06708 [Hortaea werneckii]|uniref:RING-type domain-containing protein n=1 Tax=Hortaea werneckii TaxID=91943 RepID=A0A3M7F8U3_HORWE|nr:hypothetical protein D0861_06708 [Hortaea werneckii]
MAESSAQAAKRAAEKIPPKTAACVACMDTFVWKELAEAPCGHTYCRECVSGLFRNAMTDESLFPPRCCSQLTPFLGDDLATRFSAKTIEFSTPVRTYCHDVHCSAFIPPSSIRGEVASRPECREKTCTMCKAARHQGACPQDTALQQVLKVAQGEGWRRCLCGHQFCYNCGDKWKTCRCPWFDERRLYERAAEIVDRDPIPHRESVSNERRLV